MKHYYVITRSRSNDTGFMSCSIVQSILETDLDRAKARLNEMANICCDRISQDKGSKNIKKTVLDDSIIIQYVTCKLYDGETIIENHERITFKIEKINKIEL